MQLVEPIQVTELDLKEKLQMVADTLRNASGITQCKRKLYDPKTGGMCAMGVLGFRAGIPKEDLITKHGAIGINIWLNYGLTYGEVNKISLGYIPTNTPSYSIVRPVNLSYLFQLSDSGYSFEKMADYVEEIIKLL